MNTIRTYHDAAHRSSAIQRILDERRADRRGDIRITVAGTRVMLDGTVEAYADKEAALDAALLAGEAEVVVDRIVVRPRRRAAAAAMPSVPAGR